MRDSWRQGVFEGTERVSYILLALILDGLQRIIIRRKHPFDF
jgi:hypothetical protein